MKTRHQQRGMGLLGMLAIAIMIGFYIYAAVRIIPGYIEYRTVRDIVIRVAEEYDREVDTSGDIRRSLSGYLNTNQVKSITFRDVKLVREEGKLYLDANYEERITLFWRIDLIMRYDDLVFETGVEHEDG